MIGRFFPIIGNRGQEKRGAPVDFAVNFIENKFGFPVTERKKIVKGVVNEVYLIKNKSEQEFIARISTDTQNNRFEAEQWSLGQCATVGIPVPAVLLLTKANIANREYKICLESKLPGTALYEINTLSEIERNELLNQSGEILSRIHSIPLNVFGKFDKDGKGEFCTIQEILNDPYIAKDKMLKISKEIGLDPTIMSRAFEIIEKGCITYPHTEPRLVHRDFMPKHILAEHKQITGIIDFETAIGGDPIMDLAHWDFFYKDALDVKEIIKGYTNKEVFSNDFDRIFNLWRLYLGLMHLKFQSQQKNKKGIDFAKSEITNDVNYYNLHLSEDKQSG